MADRKNDEIDQMWVDMAAVHRTNRIAWLIQAQSLKRAAIVLWRSFAEVMDQFIAEHPEGGRPGIGISDIPIRGYVYPNASLDGPMMMLQAKLVSSCSMRQGARGRPRSAPAAESNSCAIVHTFARGATAITHVGSVIATSVAPSRRR